MNQPLTVGILVFITVIVYSGNSVESHSLARKHGVKRQASLHRRTTTMENSKQSRKHVMKRQASIPKHTTQNPLDQDEQLLQSLLQNQRALSGNVWIDALTKLLTAPPKPQSEPENGADEAPPISSMLVNGITKLLALQQKSELAESEAVNKPNSKSATRSFNTRTALENKSTDNIKSLLKTQQMQHNSKKELHNKEEGKSDITSEVIKQDKLDRIAYNGSENILNNKPDPDMEDKLNNDLVDNQELNEDKQKLHEMNVNDRLDSDKQRPNFMKKVAQIMMEDEKPKKKKKYSYIENLGSSSKPTPSKRVHLESPTANCFDAFADVQRAGATVFRKFVGGLGRSGIKDDSSWEYLFKLPMMFGASIFEYSRCVASQMTWKLVPKLFRFGDSFLESQTDEKEF